MQLAEDKCKKLPIEETEDVKGENFEKIEFIKNLQVYNAVDLSWRTQRNGERKKADRLLFYLRRKTSEKRRFLLNYDFENQRYRQCCSVRSTTADSLEQIFRKRNISEKNFRMRLL